MGANWLKDAPQRLVYYDRFQSDLFRKAEDRFLTQILPTEDTVGYEQLSNLVVSKLNGANFEPRRFCRSGEKTCAGYHKIEFEEDPHEIYLDAKQVEEASAQLQKTYNPGVAAPLSLKQCGDRGPRIFHRHRLLRSLVTLFEIDPKPSSSAKAG